jgi:TPP-dependent 2-oxoacid decarboxylase
VARTGLQSQLLALVNASRLPFATMFMAKSVLDEQHPSYIGMYDGKLMNHGVGAFVEGCDCVLAIGTIFTDFNTGAFTANIDPDKLISIGHHRVRIGSNVYPNVEIKVIHRASQMFRSFQFSLDKGLVDDHLRCDIGQFASLPRLHLLPYRLEVSLHSINAS